MMNGRKIRKEAQPGSRPAAKYPPEAADHDQRHPDDGRLVETAIVAQHSEQTVLVSVAAARW
jgi:hypothetical protein